jgi:cyclophilin family peptidyl-prolyl cis-trans isomerase
MYPVTILLFTVIALSVTFSLHAFAEKGDVGILTTKFGNIIISFRDDVAPKTVANFENLTKSGFYDGTIFYRITPGFIIQGGDPNTKNGSRNTWGNGDAGYTIPPEFSNLKHTKYMVSMAHRAADINSASSQFFIVLGNTPLLDGKYTIFGEVVSGQDVVDKITLIKTDPKTNQPLDPDQARITKAVISSQEKIQSKQSGQLTNSSDRALEEQNGQGIAGKQPSQDMLVIFGSIATIIIVAIIVSIISIKLKNRSKRNIDMESREKEKTANQIQIESTKKKLTDMNSKIYDAKSELSSLQSQNETKKEEIMLVKKELVFIEKELALVGKKDDTKKTVEAAGAIAASINSKYEATKKEIELLRDAYTILKAEYEILITKLESLKIKGKYLK